ncbi:uL22m family ribosomal protein [Candidatus Tremblaya princeps]|uniref:50S ribosomal protein L22 n=1 Tax=Tremblaya princeps TaxID=189385 RepID=A0A1C3K9B0_TREPR|nr:50S ribosomal protein L22 [Candidatus Tremblaya princeps]
MTSMHFRSAVELKVAACCCRSSLRKMHPVLRSIMGLPLSSAMGALSLHARRAARIVHLVLYRAMPKLALAGLSPASAVVACSSVGSAGLLRRVSPRAKGRACIIRRRMCHITITLRSLQWDKRCTQGFSG